MTNIEAWGELVGKVGCKVVELWREKNGNGRDRGSGGAGEKEEIG